MTEFVQNQEVTKFNNQLLKIDIEDKTSIKSLENDITKYIINNPDDIYAYILLNQTLILQGLAPNAILISNKIWSMGRKINIDFEKMYIKQLINLGLNQLAYKICKSKINNILYSDLLFDLSINTGELFLLKKTISNLTSKPNINLCNKFINQIQENKSEKQFIKVMELINKNSHKYSTITKYDFINIDDKPVLNIELFLNEDLLDIEEFIEGIKETTNEFFTKEKADKFINLSASQIQKYSN